MNSTQIVEQFITDVSDKIESRGKRYEIYSPFSDAQTKNIGCSYGVYDLERRSFVVVECYLNERKGRSFDDSHVAGNRCSKCECSEMCSDEESTGLCEYRVNRGEPLSCVETEIKDNYSCDTNLIITSLYPHLFLIYFTIVLSTAGHIVFLIYYKFMHSFY